jgi:predicted permease
MDAFFQDVRYAVRQLFRARSATIVVILTLALGIGANTSMFTVLNALLFKSAPGRDTNRLAWLSNSDREGRRAGTISYPDFVAYRANIKSFESLMAWSQVALSLGGSTPERVYGSVVSGNYFSTLGIVPAQGRAFRTDDDSVAGLKPVVVISHALWARRFASNPRTVDSTIVVNGHAFTVIGIAPEGFGGIEFDNPTEIWVPFAMLAVVMPQAVSLRADPNSGWLQAIGRLKSEVSVAEANSEANVVASRIDRVSPGAMRTKYAKVTGVLGGLAPSDRGEIAPVMALVSIVPLLVLLIACANAANVQLARMLARGKELAVRRAVGASRGRLLRQLLTESIVLSLVAGALGVMLSFWLTGAIVVISDVPAFFAASLAPDRRVLVATTALAMLSGLFFGIAPALAASRPQVASALKNDSSSTVLGGRHRLRSSLVVAQVATSLLLIVVAGLFTRSLAKSLSVEPGFDAHRLATVTFDLGMLGYSPSARAAFVERVIDEANALPGVQSAAIATVMPLSGTSWGAGILPEGTVESDHEISARYTAVSSGFLRTMGIGVVKGRDFAATDRLASTQVAIVNEALARRLWPNQDAIGKRFRIDSKDEPLREVVGVTKTGKYDSLNESESAFFYVPEPQLASLPQGALSLVVRSSGDPATLLAPVSRLFRGLDPNLALYRLETLDQSLSRAVDKQRAASGMLGVFGALALLLAALGMYGVTAHGVTLRTREIGIRVSLGARTVDVLGLFVREGLRLSLIGVGIGLVLSVAISRVLAAFLFGLSATDSLTFVFGAVLLCAVAALASFIPARRAARIDPMVALRYD